MAVGVVKAGRPAQIEHFVAIDARAPYAQVTDRELTAVGLPPPRIELQELFQSEKPPLGHRPRCTLEDRFREFRDAPMSVLRRLLSVLQHPARSVEHIEVRKAPVQCLAQLQGEDFETLGKIVKRLETLHEYHGRCLGWVAKRAQPDRDRSEDLLRPSPHVMIATAKIFYQLGELQKQLQRVAEVNPYLDALRRRCEEFLADGRYAGLIAASATLARVRLDFDIPVSALLHGTVLDKLGFDQISEYSSISAEAYQRLFELYETCPALRGQRLTGRASIIHLSSQVERHISAPLGMVYRACQELRSTYHGDNNKPCFAATSSNSQVRVEFVDYSDRAPIAFSSAGIVIGSGGESGYAICQEIAKCALAHQAGLPLEGGMKATLPIFQNIRIASVTVPGAEGDGAFASTARPLAWLLANSTKGDLLILDRVPQGATNEELTALLEVALDELVRKGVTLVVNSELITSPTVAAKLVHLPRYGANQASTGQDRSAPAPIHFGSLENAVCPAELVERARGWYRSIVEGATEPGKLMAISTGTDVTAASAERPRPDEESRSSSECLGLIAESISGLYEGVHFIDQRAKQRFDQLVASGNKLALAAALEAAQYLVTHPGPKPQDLAENLGRANDAAFHIGSPRSTPPQTLLGTLHEISRLVEGLGYLCRAWPSDAYNLSLQYHLRLREFAAEVDRIDAVTNVDRIRAASPGIDPAEISEGLKEAISEYVSSRRSGVLAVFAFLRESLAIADGVRVAIESKRLHIPVNSQPDVPASFSAISPVIPKRPSGSPNAAGVKLDFAFKPATRGAVIFGPQSSGKSVATWSIGKACLAAYLQLPIDSKVSGELGGRVFILGEAKERTYQAMASNIAQLCAEDLSGATVVLDEITSFGPAKNEALTLALLEYLVARGARVVCNSNFRKRIPLVAERLGLEIYQTEFDERTGNFSYHIAATRAADIPPVAPWTFLALKKLERDNVLAKGILPRIQDSYRALVTAS